MTKETTQDIIEWGKLDAMLQFKPTLKLCADYLGIGQTTIKDHIKAKYDKTFTEYREEKMAGVKLKLQQKAMQMAMSGNATMLIFSLKNLCKWTDTPEPDIEDGDLEFV
ncbi:unnamed protein product [marine sediment metagenome]|uniref:Uncharacterized protein n=1 Tax=marine sediment metagenome TaxID=412755 RepID=X0YP10_9ZZZZ